MTTSTKKSKKQESRMKERRALDLKTWAQSQNEVPNGALKVEAIVFGFKFITF